MLNFLSEDGTDSMTAVTQEKELSAVMSCDVLVIGAGPVGLGFCQQYLQRGGRNRKVILVGDEPVAPYDRVQLSALLAGEKKMGDLWLAMPESGNGAFVFQPGRIARLDCENNVAISTSGQSFAYRQLVLATGSSAFVPDISGRDLSGVLVFRSLRDTEALAARRVRSRHVVVVGGGLLGLEAARAIRRFATRVTVVQQPAHLMNRQLSEACSETLEKAVRSQGIDVLLGQGVRKVIGDQRVEAVELRDGYTLACDTVVFCTGIKPNTQLALDAGIRVARGIVVNDCLQTSQANVYAIGECAQFGQQVYGLVGPGIEQAGVLTDHLSDGGGRYTGSQSAARLKIVHVPVFSIGETGTDNGFRGQVVTYRSKSGEESRSLYIERGRLKGACGVGEWAESTRLQQLVLEQDRILPWQVWRFRRSGCVFPGNQDVSVARWPDTATVCQCKQVSCGDLKQAIAQGACTLSALGTETGAGQACGSCHTLLTELLNDSGEKTAESSSRSLAAPLVGFALIAFVVSSLLFYMPGLLPPDSVQEFAYHATWTDGFWKQVTGFSLLGLTLLSLVVSLRKRMPSFPGSTAFWRVWHVVVGCLLLGILFLHTGAHLGENLNQWLMLDFLLAACLGTVAAIVTARAQKRATAGRQKWRQYGYWLHMLVVWPLPALIAAHVLTVYYF